MDNNFRSYADVDGVTIKDEVITPDNPTQYNDILKLSNAKNVDIIGAFITGGSEDCVDMNRNCQNVFIANTALCPNGKFGVTIKGGTRSVIIQNVEFVKHGSETDIDIGNWSDQSNEPVRQVTLANVRAMDERPVRVRVLWGERPNVIGGNVKLIVYPKILVQIYRFLRKHKLVP